jgi:hypothetical protein
MTRAMFNILRAQEIEKTKYDATRSGKVLEEGSLVMFAYQNIGTPGNQENLMCWRQDHT